MRQNIISKLRLIFSNWIFCLILITFIAIIIRSLPAYFNPAWGADFGIYYGITNYFIKSKELIINYDGWGNSYQYFPVLYAISGISHWITGIDLINIMPKIAPIFGGLTIPIFYFIVNEIVKNKRIALISAALLSVATFHVYQTSHTAPLTIGHFFMMLSIYLFLKSISNKKFIIPMLISTVLLILSHHFTTYFYLISITLILFSIVNEKLQNKKDFFILLYVSFASISSFLYWAIIAKPVFYNFMPGKMFISPYWIILFFYILLFGGYFSIKKIKSYKIKIPEIKYLVGLSNFKKFVIFFIILFSIAILSTNISIPGVTVKLNVISILYSIPMMFLISISFTGFSQLKNISRGNIVKGWIFAISLSFIYSLLSSNLFPHRHLEYIIIPLCIPAAIIINNIISYNNKQFEIKPHFSPLIKSILRNSHIKTAIIVFISVMCISNMIAAYPTIDSLNHIDERVTKPCINLFDWMNGNISNSSLVASDHRLEMLLWAEGFNITYGKTNNTWISDNINGCISEIYKSNIDYILIDDIMKNEVVYIDVGIYFYMTNESYDKFNWQPFELIYRNATYDNNNNELHWVELYKINYDFIELYRTHIMYNI